VLMLFQARGYTGRDIDCLGPAVTLLDAYERGPRGAPGRKK
jgi:hypothetical protein